MNNLLLNFDDETLYFPRISTSFDSEIVHWENDFYIRAIQRTLKNTLPAGFFKKEEIEDVFQRKRLFNHFQEHLPIVTWSRMAEPPFNLSFFLFCRFRPNAFRFFYEMVSRWLIPGKRMNALLQFAIDFILPDLSEEQMFIGGEIMLRVESPRELKTIQKNLPIIETEIRLGVESAYQANRVLEIKGLSSDEKTAMIQENIASLVKHRPQDFDYDIFSEMQHFLVICKDEFKAMREYKHMSRIICFQYLFRKALKHSFEAFPDKRFISVKLIRARLKDQEKERTVLGVVLGMSFLRENEIFDARHILMALRTLIPALKEVPGSFFVNSSRSDPTLTLYLEVEKENGLGFTLEETRQLKAELPNELKSRIEQRMNPLFMPQNEEEIMRNILTLSSQLKYVRDLPHAIISFEKQTETSLQFLLFLARVVQQHQAPFPQLLESRGSFLDVIWDRTKILGSIRKKYLKEVSVFRIRVDKASYLRQDHSVDLYKARLEVSRELTRLVGEFRDFNGGMISKERELFSILRSLLGNKIKENAFLLENFFYSLSPSIMRSVLDPGTFKKFFCMFLEGRESQSEYPYYRIEEDSEYIYMIFISDTPSLCAGVLSSIKKNNFSSLQLTSCFFNHDDLHCLGILYRIENKENASRFRIYFEECVLAGNK